MKRPPQRLKSISPFAFSGGTKELPRITDPTGTPGKKLPVEPLEATHHVHAAGGLSLKPTIRTGIPPKGIM
jgi:hypothetical protein